MTPLLLDPSPSLERCARAAYLILVDELNDELALVEAEWATLDAAEATARGVAYQAVAVERIAAENFYRGHKPSLLMAPSTSRFPSICVYAYSATPDARWDNDQAKAYRNTITVEVLVKSGPYGEDAYAGWGEELADRRLQRTMEAVLRVLVRNRGLGGIVPRGGADIPTLSTSEVFEVELDDTVEGRWYWQGCRLEWPIRKLAATEA